MMVRYVLHVQKAIRAFSPISTAFFVALNTEGSEMHFNCHVKLIQHRLTKFPFLKRCRINNAEMNKRVSILSL